MITNRRVFHFAVVAAATALTWGGSHAQTYPDKPIRVVVGAPAGGSADIVARLLGESLSGQFKQPVIVDNKPGAAGLIGMQELLKAPRDGHTLMVAVNGIASELPHIIKVPVDPMKELRPVAELTRTGLVMVGAPNVLANTVKDMVSHTKANPGKISFASYSTGSLSHTLGLQLNKLAGIDMIHVGYKGSPPALADVMGGHVQYMFDGPATSVPMVKAGKVKALATTSPHRLSSLPDVPTFAELGYPEMTEVAWMGLWVARDVPPAVTATLREAVLKALATPAFKEKYLALGVDPGSGATPDELMSSLKVAYDKQAATLKAIGFKPE